MCVFFCRLVGGLVIVDAHNRPSEHFMYKSRYVLVQGFNLVDSGTVKVGYTLIFFLDI